MMQLYTRIRAKPEQIVVKQMTVMRVVRRMRLIILITIIFAYTWFQIFSYQINTYRCLLTVEYSMFTAVRVLYRLLLLNYADSKTLLIVLVCQ